MSDGWIVFVGCAILIVGAALPLIRDRGNAGTPLPPKKDTLHDWRGDAENRGNRP